MSDKGSGNGSGKGAPDPAGETLDEGGATLDEGKTAAVPLTPAKPAKPDGK